MIQLYDYQEDCLLALQNDLEEYNSLLAILPMSAGKTTIFTRLAYEYHKNTNKKVIILCDNIKIVDQNMKRMQSMYPDIKVGKLQAENMPAISSKIIFGTIQTCKNKGKLGVIFGEIGLCIIDESHKSACDSYDKLKEILFNAKYIHFTATPFKNNELMTKMYENVSYSMSLQQLIDKGRCVKPKMISLQGFTPELIDKVRIASVAKIYLEKEKGKKTVIFMRTISQCFEMRNALVEQGIKSEAIVAKTPEKLREKFFYEFENEDLDVIVTCNVLSEGYDCPPLEVIIMPFPGTSVAKYIQRIGRALRVFPGKDNARIYAAGSVPSISKKFYQAMKYGETKSKKFNLKDELGLMEMLDIDFTKDSQIYSWTRSAVEIAEILKKMGKVNLSNMLLEKRFPKRLLKNLDLIKLGIEDGNFSDSMDSLETSIRRTNLQNIADGTSKWILPYGKQQGKHIKDTTYMYRKMHLQYCKNKGGSCIICKYIREWFFLGIRS